MDCDQPYSRKKVTVDSIELDIAVSDDKSVDDEKVWEWSSLTLAIHGLIQY